MSRLVVLVGFREVCPYDGTPLFLQLTPGKLEGTGTCNVCRNWFRAKYEPADSLQIPAHWHEDTRAATMALETISRRLPDQLSLVMLAEISPQKPTL